MAILNEPMGAAGCGAVRRLSCFLLVVVTSADTSLATRQAFALRAASCPRVGGRATPPSLDSRASCSHVSQLAAVRCCRRPGECGRGVRFDLHRVPGSPRTRVCRRAFAHAIRAREPQHQWPCGDIQRSDCRVPRPWPTALLALDAQGRSVLSHGLRHGQRTRVAVESCAQVQLGVQQPVQDFVREWQFHTSGHGLPASTRAADMGFNQRRRAGAPLEPLFGGTAPPQRAVRRVGQRASRPPAFRAVMPHEHERAGFCAACPGRDALAPGRG